MGAIKLRKWDSAEHLKTDEDRKRGLSPVVLRIENVVCPLLFVSPVVWSVPCCFCCFRSLQET